MTRWPVLFFATIAIGSATAASYGPTAGTSVAAHADPDATQRALSALLAAANDTIPRTSSCHGDFGQVGKARVKDLLAMRLAYLHNGTNVVKGHCTGVQCTVNINHAAGEDVASAAISFAVGAGKARTSTLHCSITP